MRLLSRLEDGEKSCVIWHILFRHSPKRIPYQAAGGAEAFAFQGFLSSHARRRPNENMQEKRELPRTVADANILAHDINTGRHLGRVVNLNSEGMMLIGPEPVESNFVFQLELALGSPHRGHESLRCGVESLWSRKAHQSGHYWAGFHIIDISLEAAEIIESLVEMWLVGKDDKR